MTSTSSMTTTSTTLQTSTITSTSPSTTASQTYPTNQDTLGAWPSNIPSSTSASSSTDNNSDGLVHYYFVFFALILCIVALACVVFWRRRRNRTTADRSYAAHTQPTTARDVHNATWLGRWRSAEISREEGLNEEGEAPPPYVPKSVEESRARSEGSRHHQEESSTDDPAIPLQRLSRGARHNPPEYQANESHSEHISGSVPSGSRQSG